MTVFCTYCSAKKSAVAKLLPAIKRYKSKRINAVYESAIGLHLAFYILSGKHGILKPSDEIANYDHLLLFRELESHSDLVAKQLKDKYVKYVIFFTNPESSDENLNPYIECMKMACEKASITLNIIEINIQD